MSTPLQWGHVFSDVEMFDSKKKRNANKRLQWGQVFSDVEIKQVSCRLVADRRASMGPRLFRRGNSGLIAMSKSLALCFNGATSFQTWKFLTDNEFPKIPIGFNGATSFQTWKFGIDAGGMIPYTNASMGPRLFRRGNCLLGQVRNLLRSASMGPRLFRRGNRTWKGQRGLFT